MALKESTTIQNNFVSSQNRHPETTNRSFKVSQFHTSTSTILPKIITTQKVDNMGNDEQETDRDIATPKWDDDDGDQPDIDKTKMTGVSNTIFGNATTPVPPKTNTDDLSTALVDIQAHSKVLTSPEMIGSSTVNCLPGVMFQSNITYSGVEQSQSECSDYLTTPGHPVHDETNMKELYLGVRVQDCSHYTCDSFENMCRCDAACLLLYGDCCYDYIEHIAKNLHQNNITAILLNRTKILQSVLTDEMLQSDAFIYNHSKCVWSETNIDAFWMISKCPNSFTDETIIDKCENGDDFGVDNIPLDWTDAGGRTWLFRNAFCAFCHGIDPNNNSPALKKWKIQIYCVPGKEKGILPPGNISLFNLGPDCYPVLSSTIEKSDTSYARICTTRKNEDVTCEETRDPYIFKLLCETYIHSVRRNETVYLNPHCAICETGSDDYYSPCMKLSTDEYRSGAVDLQILFDFSPDTGFTPRAFCEQTTDCFEFEVYDCISKTCRFLYCTNNQVPYFGNCISSNRTNKFNHWYEAILPKDLNGSLASPLYIQIDVLTTSELSETVIVDNIEQFNSYMTIVTFAVEINILNLETNESKTTDNNIGESDWVMSTVEPRTDSKTTQTVWNSKDPRENPDTDSKPEENIETGLSDTNDYNGKTSAGSDVTIRTNMYGVDDTIEDNNPPLDLPKSVSYKRQFHYSYSITLTIKADSLTSAKQLIRTVSTSSARLATVSGVTVSARTYTDLDNLLCDTGNVTVEFKRPILDDMSKVKFSTIEKNVSVNKIYWSLSDEYAERNVFDTVAVCLSQYKIPEMKCNMTGYERNEVVFRNKKMYIKNTTIYYSESEYVIVGMKIFVCVDKLKAFSYVIFFRYSKIQRILSNATSSVSLLALILICITHVKLRKLRNKHGLNLLALSATMSVIQVLLLVQAVPSGGICITYAVCLHFLVLKMFVWTNIIGFDMSITFYSNTLSQSSNVISRFVKYFLIAVMLPLTVVAACLSLDLTGASLRPDYGAGDICWITSSTTLVIFFIVPVCVSLSLNLVLFSVTLYAIQSAKIKSTAKTTARHRNYCLAYFKLSVILGFTWLVGVIAAFVAVQWLWYVHIVLNGLQGLSLFFCTMVNARTVGAFKEQTPTSKLYNTKISNVSKRTKYMETESNISV